MCSYVEKYGLQEPSDDIQYVLKRIAVKLGKTQRVKAITGVGKKMQIQILLHTVLLTSDLLVKLNIGIVQCFALLYFLT